MIEFIPHLHEYRDGEMVIPSVTQILKDAGYIGNFYTVEAAERGTAVHEMCAKYVTGKKHDNIGRKLAELEYMNGFTGWFDTRADTTTVTPRVEVTIDNTYKEYRYAGKFDLLCDVNGFLTLVDIKTGVHQDWHGIQLAAYALAANPARCMNLYLSPDGAYAERYIDNIPKRIHEWGEALEAYYTGSRKTPDENRSWFL